MLRISRPTASDLPAFHTAYVAGVAGDRLDEALSFAGDRLRAVIARVPLAREGHRYAAGKWSIKEVVQHVIDCERIFAYRALRCARNDATPLAGFDENAYAPEAQADRRTLADLMTEHDTVRAATVQLFDSFGPHVLEHRVAANGLELGVAALGWIIAGHAVHHACILEERYFN